MPIFNIPIRKADYFSWGLEELNFGNQEQILDYANFVSEVKSGAKYLQTVCIADLVNFFDSLAEDWIAPNSAFMKRYSKLGVAFLLNFIRKENLERLLEISLRGNINYIDNFCDVLILGKKMMAHPRGIVTHWLAGNVPVLGMISLITGMLTKNANIIKLPKEYGLVLPCMVAEFAGHKIKKIDGRILDGGQLINSVRCVYCEKDDLVSQGLLSSHADVRVAWGGREAVEAVLSLPKHYGTEDVIFGPKYSFVLIGRNSFDLEELDKIAYRLALDASVFEQRGCNSPHTVFVEEGGQIDALGFSKALAKGMDRALKRIPKQEISAGEAYAIANIRSEYNFSGEVFSSKGTEWTIIYSQQEELANPCYSRVLFVRPIRDIYRILNFIDKQKQTLGLLIDETRKLEFVKAITAKGIERVTDIGKMSLFDYPWDGMFPIDRFIRWVSLS